MTRLRKFPRFFSNTRLFPRSIGLPPIRLRFACAYHSPSNTIDVAVQKLRFSDSFFDCAYSINHIVYFASVNFGHRLKKPFFKPRIQQMIKIPRQTAGPLPSIQPVRGETITRFIRAEDFILRRPASGLLIVSFLQLRYSGAYMRAQDPQGEQDERKKIENFGLDRNGTFSVYVCIIHSPNMGRRSRTQNAVYTAFSCRGQLHYMDGLRTFKRETRLSFIGGKSARRYLRTNCNIRCLLIEPVRLRHTHITAYKFRYIDACRAL